MNQLSFLACQGAGGGGTGARRAGWSAGRRLARCGRQGKGPANKGAMPGGEASACRLTPGQAASAGLPGGPAGAPCRHQVDYPTAASPWVGCLCGAARWAGRGALLAPAAPSLPPHAWAGCLLGEEAACADRGAMLAPAGLSNCRLTPGQAASAGRPRAQSC